MTKKLLITAYLLLAIFAVRAGEGQKVSTKVQKVIVFLNGAQVTRMATVQIGTGTSTLIFENLSAAIDVQSIQVHADGEFTILSVKHELDFLKDEVKSQRLEELKIKQKEIQDRIELQRNILPIYQEEQNLLMKNQVVSGQNNNLDLLRLKQALDFQTARLLEIRKKSQEINNEIVALSAELAKYNAQIYELNRGNSGTATSNILVTVSSKRALESKFFLSYVVPNASWYPTYDVRAKNVNSPIVIAYKANVSQKSGEDWKNIKLTLSTGNPSVSGSKPELSPYYLNFGMMYSDQADKITRVTGRVTAQDDGQPIPGVSIRVKGTSIGTQTDTQGNYSIQVPSAGQTLVYSFIGYTTTERPVSASIINLALSSNFKQLNEVVVTGYSTSDVSSGLSGKAAGLSVSAVNSPEYSEAKSIPVVVNRTENQTNIEFDIANSYSIPSDGKKYTVEINQLDIPASYEYAVNPKISTDVFLTARLTDWNKYSLLSGEANLFFEGTFIGKSLINTDATTDTLSFSLGTDKNIVVTRTSLKDLKQRQTIGSNIKETRDWQIEVKNRKNQPINLLVEDQVPVSQNTSIEVENQELSGGKLEKLLGRVTWNIKLKPADDQKLELKYQVKYPKNQTVIVQ